MKISQIVSDPNFHWPRIPGDPHKGTGGNYMPLQEALSRHTGLPPGHLMQKYPELMDYVNVQGQAFNHARLSNPQLSQYTAHNKLALRACEACDYYYAHLNWPRENVGELLRQAGL